MDEQAKKPWLSKTLWLNAISAVGLIAAPSIVPQIQNHGVEIGVGLNLVNILLRLVTKGRVSLRE